MSECIWEYHLLYRDLLEILGRSRRPRLRFARILKRAGDRAHAVMQGLVEADVVRGSPAEIDAAATDGDERAAIRDGIVQVMLLLSPSRATPNARSGAS